MKTYFIILFAVSCLFISGAAQAKTGEITSPFELIEAAHNYVQDNVGDINYNGGGLSMNLSDHVKSEEGAFEFFLSPSTGSARQEHSYGYSPSELNAIEPAAGIKFRMQLD